MSVHELRVEAVRRLLQMAVRARPADALMLSGGVDSSLVAALDPTVPAYTVCLQGHELDLQYAAAVVDVLGVPWTPITITVGQALAALNELVVLTRSFDPALLNDVPLYVAMRRARQSGARIIRTGDFADSLFAGYEFLWRETDLRTYLTNLLPHLTLASHRLGARMGLTMNYPYLHPGAVQAALDLERSDNIQTLAGAGPGDFHARVSGSEAATEHTWGKIALRRAAADLLPPRIVWRIKTDLEYGSGMYLLEAELAGCVTDRELDGYASEGRSFWGLPHAALYKIYRRAGLKPLPPSRSDWYACSWCGGGVVRGRRHCITCGAFPANMAKV
ncbi:MAG TPA: asparagine synthase C-terminal domain-containing protein [Candidatus Saccharimonadia bacterium]